MFVESIANRHARIDAAALLGDVLPLLKDYPGLVVTDGESVVGGISRGALFRTFADHWLSNESSARDVLQEPVREYVQEVPVVRHDTPVEDAIVGMVGGEAPLVVVLDRRSRPYGIISWMEVNQYLREITGMNDQQSVRFSLALVDMPGQLARVAELVGRAGANITALTVSDPKVLNWVHVALRVDRGHAEIARMALERAGIDIISEQ